MSREQLFYLGDTPLIKINCLYDISNASVFEIKFKKPNDETGKWVGTLSGTQYIEYQTVVGDLDVVGTWTLQAFVDWGVIEKFGNAVTFKVNDLFRS